MAEDLNFIDLVSLTRIQPDTIVEKFGGLINSSFFDASNILGSLMQKGMINFTNSAAGQNAITITDIGKQTIKECEDRAKSDFDALDFAIITQLSGGKRGLPDLGGAVNVRQRDLALHLYKLTSQQYVSYDIRNGSIDIALTEKGFLQVKSGMPKPKAQQAQASAQQPQQGAQQAAGVQAAEQAQAEASVSSGVQQAQQAEPQEAEAVQAQAQSTDLQELEARMIRAKRRSIYMVVGIVVIIILFVVALILIEMKII